MARVIGHVAVVTGASSGIGEAIALSLAKRGVRVGLLARRGAPLEALADRIRGAGGQALAAPSDVAFKGEVEAAVAEVKLRLGPPDLVVANAGIGWPGEPGTYDPDGSLRIYRVNVLGALNVIYACLPDMLEAGAGRICGVSSLASYQGVPGRSEYCGSKAALRIQLEALRAELRPRGIIVTTVCPGFVRTPMTDVHDIDLPRLLEPEAAAERILAAVARGRREVMFPWSMAMTVRIGRLVPRLLYDRVIRRLAAKKGGRTQARSTEV